MLPFYGFGTNVHEKKTIKTHTHIEVVAREKNGNLHNTKISKNASDK